MKLFTAFAILLVIGCLASKLWVIIERTCQADDLKPVLLEVASKLQLEMTEEEVSKILKNYSSVKNFRIKTDGKIWSINTPLAWDAKNWRTIILIENKKVVAILFRYRDDTKWRPKEAPLDRIYLPGVRKDLLSDFGCSIYGN